MGCRVESGGIRVEFQPMSPEDMQRTMQFLLNQQAQFAADMSRVDARLEKLTGKTDQLVDALFGLTGIVGNLATQQERTDQQLRDTNARLGELTGVVGNLATQQERTNQQLRDTNAQLGELSDHVKTVESHLDLLIQTFERHLREEHGRRPS